MRWPLIILVYGLIVLVVAFAVLCGASQLSAAIGDSAGATLLWRVAAGCLILLVIDILLLVGILSIKALDGVAAEKPKETSPDTRRDHDSAPIDSQ
jgi:hypothetical protein